MAMKTYWAAATKAAVGPIKGCFINFHSDTSVVRGFQWVENRAGGTEADGEPPAIQQTAGNKVAYKHISQQKQTL